MIDLCLDVVFTHGPQLFVKLGRYLMGAQVLNSLRGKKQSVREGILCVSAKRSDTGRQ